MPELHGSSFILRPYLPDDAEGFTRAANNRNVWQNLGNQFPYPYTIDHARAWIAQCAARSDGSTHYTIEIDGVSSGSIGMCSVPKWSPDTFEIGYWLAEPHWGRGIVTEAVGLWTQYLIEAHDARRLQAFVYDWNPASARVLEKNGFELEGRLRGAVCKDGRTGDCLAYGRLR